MPPFFCFAKQLSLLRRALPRVKFILRPPQYFLKYRLANPPPGPLPEPFIGAGECRNGFRSPFQGFIL
jgi:hypothetical protein